ncbi:substrate-binding periplasmic protein [Aliiglaciecola lipolytica]|uniref:Solute-binding protein family 3/N-terminal domain-containing protein n=1 Tax=Aliiglaciecola lipolytica E3 TaxID=1127673 RepID=K6YPK6_9ALTE|nr:transporter substrate-binding domain-containing protein [Aliiglaciecola lipolytica]GAC13260.1 hypothetical protein GLIP_0614 [Aliiglaciecola lipolytica E3]
MNKFLIFSIFITVLLNSELVLAEEQQSRKIRCATTHYPPFTIFSHENKELGCLDTDAINALATHFNWKIRIDNIPWERLKKTLGKNNYDCYFSMADQPYRREHVNYTTTPLHVTQYGLFTLKSESEKPIKSYATMRGISAPQRMKTHFKLENLPEVKANNIAILVELLLKGRVDAIVTNADVGMYEFELHGAKNEVNRAIYPHYKLPVYLVFSKHVKDIDILSVNQFLEQHMRKSKENQ